MSTTLSLNLPESLAKASQETAKKLGVSRTEFIRQAIAHEIAQFEAHLEEHEMAKSMKAMKQSKNYLAESDELTSSLHDDLPKDKEEWWNKKS